MKRLYIKKQETDETTTENDQEVKQNRRPQQYNSRQSNFTQEEIDEKLKGYIPLKTMEQKKYVETLTPFKTWIRYHNTKSDQFRTGGILVKASYPDYLVLRNNRNNVAWSVQLKDNIIYVPDPKIQRDKEKEQRVKDKLYEMFQRGELKKA
jgi:hypothetical protein